MHLQSYSKNMQPARRYWNKVANANRTAKKLVTLNSSNSVKPCLTLPCPKIACTVSFTAFTVAITGGSIQR